MMWLGYDAPDAFYDSATLTEGRAEDGGERFADAIDGLRASRPYDAAHLTAIGHSYGSTTVAHAATDHHIDVDDIVLVGSPGAGGGVDHAERPRRRRRPRLGRPQQRGPGRRPRRPRLGRWAHALRRGLGNDPSEDDFGAHRFEAEDVDPQRLAPRHRPARQLLPTSTPSRSTTSAGSSTATAAT